MANGNFKTLMVKESTFKLDDAKLKEWANQTLALLGNYDYHPTEGPVLDILREGVERKGWMFELFQKSEYYNGNGQIVIPAKLNRPVDMDKVREFYVWANREFDKIIEGRELYIGLFRAVEYEQHMNKAYRTWDQLPCDESVTYHGFTWRQLRDEYYRMRDRMEQFRTDNYGCRSVWFNGDDHYITNADYHKYSYFCDILGHSLMLEHNYSEKMEIFGEKRADAVARRCERGGFQCRPIVGQKVSKFIGKLLKEVGLNKVVDKQVIHWTDENGQRHQRTKDMGYNYQFAMLGDAINPYTMDREVVISINPIDFYTMSFGYKWASCQTIDKENVREVPNHQYSGCYSGATESYFGDSSTFVVYVRPTEEELKKIGESNLPMEEQSKMKRCLFFLGEDKLVQSRTYPDGRDGGDGSLAEQLRNIVQKQIAELYDTPNMWQLKKGISECREVIYRNGDIEYPDWIHYDDCNVSYLKRVNGNLNHKKIYVGSSTIICPSCGDRHDSQEHITCTSCFEGEQWHVCDECGCDFRESDGINTDDGNHFCSEGCARRNDYVRTCDAGWRHIDYCRHDDYDDEWYYYNEDGICTEDDHWYQDEYNAREDGYKYAEEDGRWYIEDEVVRGYDGITFYLPNYPDAVETPDGWYHNTEEAENDGWVVNDSGEWVAA